jgi:hypothetical protein
LGALPRGVPGGLSGGQPLEAGDQPMKVDDPFGYLTVYATWPAWKRWAWRNGVLPKRFT